MSNLLFVVIVLLGALVFLAVTVVLGVPDDLFALLRAGRPARKPRLRPRGRTVTGPGWPLDGPRNGPGQPVYPKRKNV